MDINKQDFLRQAQEAGASEVIIKFNNTSTKPQPQAQPQPNNLETYSDNDSTNSMNSADSADSVDSEFQKQEQSHENISSNNQNGNRFPWQEIYFDALKYNKEVNGESMDSVQHIDDASAEVLRESLESKITRKSKCEPIYEDLAYLTNYLYDTYDFNYSTNNTERDAQGNYVYNIEKAIIEAVKTNYLKINLEETKQIIEAIIEKYGDNNKIDDSNLINVISTIACNSRGKQILEIVLQFMDKFECIETPVHLKEFVNKIEQIVNKYGDISILKDLVLAIEENDIGKDILMKKILEPVLKLKKDEYEKLKKDRVLNNGGNMCEISAEDLQTLIANYETKKAKTKYASKVDDIVKERRKKRKLKNSVKNIGVDKIFTRKPMVILGAAGMIAAAFLSVKTIFFNNNSESLRDISATPATELETEDEMLTEDINKEMPEALQEDNKNYYIVQYKDPISKEKELVYLQMDRDAYEIPATDNVIITKDGVTENVDKYEITPVLTEMYLTENSGVIDVTDDIEIEDGSYIYVLCYNPQEGKDGDKYRYFYNDGENIYTSTISGKKLSKMEETGFLVNEYNDGENIIPLSTYIPTFFTTKNEITISEQEGSVISSKETLLGNKEITANGERINAIGMLSKGQNNDQSEIVVATIEGTETEKIESSIDKYEKEEIQEDVSSGFKEVGEYTLDEEISKLNIYSSSNTNGIPKYIFGEGVKIILYEYDFGFIVADENGNSGSISIEDGEYIKEYIEQKNEQENFTDNETENDTDYEEQSEDESNDYTSDNENDEEYIEENTEDTELSSFDALEEEWDGEEIE